MSELILKYNNLDATGKKELMIFLNHLLKIHASTPKKSNKETLTFDYSRFQFPIQQLKFDRDEINSRD